MSSTDVLEIENLDVKPSEIAVHPDNPRHELGPIDDLVASAKSTGIIEPLIVAMPYDGMTKSIGSAKYLLIAGHRRLAAAKKARLQKIPVRVRNDWSTRGDQVAAMMIENLHRRDLTPVEEGEGYQLLMDIEGLSQAKVATRVQQPPKRVRERLKIVKLPKGVLSRIHEGQITLEEGVEAAAFAGDPEVMENLEKVAGTNNFTYELTRAKERRKSEQDFRSVVKQIREAGVTEIESASTAVGDGARRIEYLPGNPYVYDRRPAGWWAYQKSHHGDCPHTVVVIDEKSLAVEFLCTDPESHRSGGVVDGPELPETEEEKAARQAEEEAHAAREQARLELQNNLDAAAAVRREHVASVLHDKAGDVELATKLLRRHHRRNDEYISTAMGTEWPVLRSWLRLDDAEGDTRTALITGKIDRLTLPALAILTAIAWYSADDRQLTDARATHPVEDEDTIEWIRILTDDFAYQWSDFEREHFGLDADGHVPDADDAEGDS